jgi:hypothetical protein
MKQRERATDRNGRPIAPGMKVRVLGEDGQPEGTVVRLLGDYDTVTVLIDQKGKTERLYESAEVEVVDGAR